MDRTCAQNKTGCFYWLIRFMLLSSVADVSPPPYRHGKRQSVVHHSLCRGPCWPPSSNFRLHVSCAGEPARTNSRSSQFLLICLGEYEPVCSQAPRHVWESWNISLWYFCGHHFNVNRMFFVLALVCDATNQSHWLLKITD